jgi:hypothetical protein
MVQNFVAELKPKTQLIRVRTVAGLDKLRLRETRKLCATPARIHRRKRMEPAEKIATLEQRISWTKKHWIPFFSEMPLYITSLGSVRSPFAFISRAAVNSATFSALDESDLNIQLGDDPQRGLNFTTEKTVPSPLLVEL